MKKVLLLFYPIKPFDHRILTKSYLDDKEPEFRLFCRFSYIVINF